MEKIYQTTISKACASKKYAYPTIRLPHSHCNVIGSQAHIYESSYQNNLAFFIVIPNNEGTSESDFPATIDPFEKSLETTLASRLQALEAEVQEIRQWKQEMEKEASKTECCYGDSNPSRRRERPLLPKESQFDDISQRYEVHFSHEDLNEFLVIRCRGIESRAGYWINKVMGFIWDTTQGILSPSTLDQLASFYIGKYSGSSLEKCFNYTRAFIDYLYKKRMDSKILGLKATFDKPKNRKPIKLLTTRILTKEDIKILIQEIQADQTLTESRRRNFIAMVLFLIYSGQRPQTAAQLSCEQFREAIQKSPPVLTVKSDQDKIRMEHYVPLHPEILPFIKGILGDKDRSWDRSGNKNGSMRAFDYLGLQRWLREHKVPMIHCKGKIELKDLRKGFEQISDEIEFNDANKNFIMTHGVSSINWQSYKQFLPENVYNRYLDKWGKVSLIA